MINGTAENNKKTEINKEEVGKDKSKTSRTLNKK